MNPAYSMHIKNKTPFKYSYFKKDGLFYIEMIYDFHAFRENCWHEREGNQWFINNSTELESHEIEHFEYAGYCMVSSIFGLTNKAIWIAFKLTNTTNICYT